MACSRYQSGNLRWQHPTWKGRCGSPKPIYGRCSLMVKVPYTAPARAVINCSTRYFPLYLKLKMQTSWLQDRDRQVISQTQPRPSVASQERVDSESHPTATAQIQGKLQADKHLLADTPPRLPLPFAWPSLRAVGLCMDNPAGCRSCEADCASLWD